MLFPSLFNNPQIMFQIFQKKKLVKKQVLWSSRLIQVTMLINLQSFSLSRRNLFLQDSIPFIFFTLMSIRAIYINLFQLMFHFLRCLVMSLVPLTILRNHFILNQLSGIGNMCTRRLPNMSIKCFPSVFDQFLEVLFFFQDRVIFNGAFRLSSPKVISKYFGK